MSNCQEMVAPFGSYEAIFGTNPIAFGCPVDNRPPIVLDMATSAEAYYHLKAQEATGGKIRSDVAYDNHGNPTTCAKEALQGALRTFDRGAKSSGLALMVELLAGALPGAPMVDKANSGSSGSVVIAIDPRVFGGGASASLLAMATAEYAEYESHQQSNQQAQHGQYYSALHSRQSQHISEQDQEQEQGGGGGEELDSPLPLLVGDRVEGNYHSSGTWYKGAITDVSEAGLYDIEYDDDETEEGLSRTLIRRVQRRQRNQTNQTNQTNHHDIHMHADANQNHVHFAEESASTAASASAKDTDASSNNNNNNTGGVAVGAGAAEENATITHQTHQIHQAHETRETHETHPMKFINTKADNRKLFSAGAGDMCNRIKSASRLKGVKQIMLPGRYIYMGWGRVVH